MKVEFNGFTVKVQASRKAFIFTIDTPKDKRDRAETRREMMNLRVKHNLRAVGE